MRWATATHGVTLIEGFAELLQCVEVLEIVLGLVRGISYLAVEGPPRLHVWNTQYIADLYSAMAWGDPSSRPQVYL